MSHKATDRIAVHQIAPGQLITANDYLTGSELRLIQKLTATTRLKGIAVLSELTENSAKTYAARLYQKIGVHSMADLVVWAVKHGLIKFEQGEDKCQQLTQPNW